MSNKKSLAEEALLQMENLEKVVAKNAKGILASTMKEEISELVKESLKETEHEESEKMETYEQIEDDELDMDMDTEVDTDVEDAMGDEDSEDDVMSMSDIDFDSDEEGDEEEMLDVDIEPIDLTGVSDEEVLKVFKMMDDSDGIIVKQDNNKIHLSDNDGDVEYIIQVSEANKGVQPMEEEDDEFVMMGGEGDMEGVSAEELLDRIFAEEQMEGDYSEMNMDEDDYSEMDMDEINMDEMNMDEMNMDEMNMDEDDDIVYEISFDDEDDTEVSEETVEVEMGEGRKPKKQGYNDKEDDHFGGEDKGRKPGMSLKGKRDVAASDERRNKDRKYSNMKTMDKGSKEETKEAARTYGMGSKEGRGLRKGITPNRNLTYEGVSKEEVQLLREKNDEYRKALNIFREKLNEVAVFNSNLAYATRLFTEHSTTKQEKINILRRFDDVETLKESKNLYGLVKNELSGGNSRINESLEQKIEKTNSSGSAVNLIESKTYQNPQFLRMKDLMSKITK